MPADAHAAGPTARCAARWPRVTPELPEGQALKVARRVQNCPELAAGTPRVIPAAALTPEQRDWHDGPCLSLDG